MSPRQTFPFRLPMNTSLSLSSMSQPSGITSSSTVAWCTSAWPIFSNTPFICPLTRSTVRRNELTELSNRLSMLMHIKRRMPRSRPDMVSPAKLSSALPFPYLYILEGRMKSDGV